MKIALLGGTGLISTGIAQACQALDYELIVLQRGQRPSNPAATTVLGDRYQLADLQTIRRYQPDVVIDMLGFQANDATLVVEAFAGATQQLIFCSTCCVYAVDQRHGPLWETSPLGSHWHYGQNKAACEAVYQQAAAAGAFELTIFRPSHVYGADFFIHQWGFDGANHLARIKAGLPVPILEQGQQLWQACQRDDVGRAFALACLRPASFDQIYHPCDGTTFTWHDFYQLQAEVLGTNLQTISIPHQALETVPNGEFEFTQNISQYDFAAGSHNLQRDIPEWQPQTALAKGIEAFWQTYGQTASPEYAPALNDLLELYR